MPFAEPATTLTDYLLALAAWGWGLRLVRTRHDAARLMGLAFLATGLAAAVGGSLHGFGPRWSDAERAAAWLATYAAIGLANLLLLGAAIRAFAPRAYELPLLGLCGFRFGVYLILLASHREFRYVVYDLGGTLLALVVLALLGRSTRAGAAAPWVLTGVAITFAGALVQRTGVRFHEHFNHNDLFHLVQVAGLFAFYRAGTVLAGCAPRRGPQDSGTVSR
ncbi:MAG TPA: hypothetical protein VFM88_09585 [Vicinamibacteria bacterium]|nr:hypothetical protein [Vicinamibacteria bacterium]